MDDVYVGVAAENAAEIATAAQTAQPWLKAAVDAATAPVLHKLTELQHVVHRVSPSSGMEGFRSFRSYVL